MRADRCGSRAVARRRPLAVAVLVAVAGTTLALASAPAAEAAVRVGATPPKPHATATASTSRKPHGHRGRGHGAATSSPKAGPRATTATPKTAPARPSATAPAGVRRYATGSDPSYVAPSSAPAVTPKPSATAPAPAPKHDGTKWAHEDGDRSDRGVAHAFTAELTKAGRSAGFPALLIAVMVVFLLVQHRLDKRDAKLSHADWASDQGLEFSAPATLR